MELGLEPRSCDTRCGHPEWSLNCLAKHLSLPLYFSPFLILFPFCWEKILNLECANKMPCYSDKWQDSGIALWLTEQRAAGELVIKGVI